MLEDKVILITGSSRGIGAATARLAAGRWRIRRPRRRLST